MSLGPRNLLVSAALAVVVSAGCGAQSATPPSTLPPASPSAPVAALLKYSAVISTYPADVTLCGELRDWFKGALGLDVSCADVFHFAGAGSKADSVVASLGGTKIEGSQEIFRDYGVKIVMDAGTTLGGTTYPTGAMLTVDSNRNWTQVSGWD